MSQRVFIDSPVLHLTRIIFLSGNKDFLHWLRDSLCFVLQEILQLNFSTFQAMYQKVKFPHEINFYQEIPTKLLRKVYQFNIILLQSSGY